MSTKKDRQRQLARQAYQRRLEREAQRVRRQRHWAVGSVAAVLVIALGISVPAALGVFSGQPAQKASAATNPSAAASAAPSASPSPTEAPAIVDGKCVYTAGGTAARKVNLPPTAPDTTSKYTATVLTNRGTIVISLDNAKAPCTVGSFVSLADQKYFNNTSCPRLVTTGFYVLQCGDPTGTGSGGPGYTFDDENLAGATYPAGTLAMANGGPGTNGSQFFLVYKDTPAGSLAPSYTPFGTITSGLNVLTSVAAKGDDNSNPAGGGKPTESVQIESVTISKT